MDRTNLRKEKIKARDSIVDKERMVLSRKIVEQILFSEEFQEAKNVMIYKGIRGEVRLEALEEAVKGQNKQLLYPLCVSDSEMIALLPDDEDAWQSGYFGIQEPIRERSQEVAPEDIDLVICPCTVFDEQGGRMGMGAGFYDRYLEKCTKAVVAAVAFECQKAEQIPMEPWDKPMDLVFTERDTYRRRSSIMKQPRIEKDVFIAPSADVLGDVVLESGSSVWYQAVIRGDCTTIHIGKNTNIQDKSVLHADPGRPLTIGEGVTIGHGAIIHGSYIGDNTLIGMGAIVLDGAKIGKNCIVGAGALVTGSTEIPDGMMALGSPAKFRRPLTEEEIEHNKLNALEYVHLAKEQMK